MITFQPLTQESLPLLFMWFCNPHVSEFWPEPKTWNEFEEKWKKKFATDFRFIAYLDGIPFGYIHYYHVSEETRKKYEQLHIPASAVGIDLLIGDPSYLGKGYGKKLIEEFIEFIKQQEPQCKAIIIDPASNNVRAIACYKRVGFEYTSSETVDDTSSVPLMIYRLD